MAHIPFKQGVPFSEPPAGIDLAPCPFCGASLTWSRKANCWVHHGKPGRPLAGPCIAIGITVRPTTEDVEAWNTRVVSNGSTIDAKT